MDVKNIEERKILFTPYGAMLICALSWRSLIAYLRGLRNQPLWNHSPSQLNSYWLAN